MQVTSATTPQATTVQNQPAPARPQQSGGFDGDGDGSGSGQASGPVANLNGQLTGQLVNTKA